MENPQGGGKHVGRHFWGGGGGGDMCIVSNVQF